jgi:hypothetical protein
MEMILRYQTGLRAEAVLLAAGADRMRIAVRDGADTVELRLVFGQWVSEDGGPLEIESLISIPNTGIVHFCPDPAPMTRTAGNTMWTI